jgi:hypothetical protein
MSLPSAMPVCPPDGDWSSIRQLGAHGVFHFAVQMCINISIEASPRGCYLAVLIMIISASYKTDIPTFYGDWFMNRLRAGYCKMVNPYSHHVLRVSLAPGDADGFVFWTKNIGPFLMHLPAIRGLGYPFVVQYTITGYPRTLERAVVNATRSVEHMRRIAEEYGPRVPVWRYDPIVISSETPMDFHRRNFESLCRQLEGATDEVAIAFMNVYRKTLRNLNAAGREFGLTWEDPSGDAKRQLVLEMVQMAGAHGMRLAVCTQRDYLVAGAHDARCIDAERLGAIAGHPIHAQERGHRTACGCFASRDIGEYDTCPHGCIYCYAVHNSDNAQRRFRDHDPASEFLFKSAGIKDVPDNSQRSLVTLPLFATQTK